MWIRSNILKVIHVIAIFAIGIIFEKIIEIMFFLIIFFLLRKYNDGYHASIKTRCLALTIYLKKKGVLMGEPVKYEWGTYEVRLNDVDGNEVVICELWQ